MSMTISKAEGSVWLGSVMLTATSAFHATGYATVVRYTSAPGVAEFLQAVAKGLWLYASYHWLFIALLCAIAARFPSRLSRLVLLISALVLAADIVLLLVYVGPFVGELLLAAVTVAYMAGAVLQRRTMDG